jgi:hypothetical protein
MQLNLQRRQTAQPVAISLNSKKMSLRKMKTRSKRRVRNVQLRGESKRPRSRRGRRSTRSDRHCSRKRGRRGERSERPRIGRDARSSRRRWP